MSFPKLFIFRPFKTLNLQETFKNTVSEMKKTIAATLICFASYQSGMARPSLQTKGGKAFKPGDSVGTNLPSGTYYNPKLPPISATIYSIKEHILEKGVLPRACLESISTYNSDNQIRMEDFEVQIGARAFSLSFVANSIPNWSNALWHHHL